MPVPVTSIPATIVSTLLSTTKVVVLLIAPFTFAVGPSPIVNLSPTAAVTKILAMFKVVPD